MAAAHRLSLLLILAVLAWPAASQQRYPSPDAAAQALVDALGSKRADPGKLAQVLGPDWKTYVPVQGVDRDDVDAFLARYREHHVLKTPVEGRALLNVGREAWTFPIPLIRNDKGWAFDLKAGEPEIRARRIGRNELAAVQAALAYHDAQMDYAAKDRNDDGVLEYARKFVSTDGQHDGLYWDAQPDEDDSPLGPLFGDDTPQGEWHGYHFRILDAQGPSAPRGAYSYVLDGHMSRGFALVAWPARYGDSGVMSFMISHDGEVFESDLGPDSAATAAAMKSFDPDSSWKQVDAATLALAPAATP
jgi:hypothetical protein